MPAWICAVARLLDGYDIMNVDLQKQRKQVATWAMECADKARLLMKHLRALKLSGSRYIPIELQPLLDRVVLSQNDPAGIERLPSRC